MRVTCKEFKTPYAHLNTDIHDIQFSWPQLRHAVVTMGSPSLRAAMPSTQHAFAFALHKIFALESVIEIDDQGTLQLPSRYDDLDQSEKGVLSYWLGMCITKVVAAEILDVPWPVHLRHLMKAIRVYMRDKKFPDYVGIDAKDKWHVIEAKCFQTEPGRLHRRRWEDQVDSVDFISDQLPDTRSYCLTRLKPRISIELTDPEDEIRKRKINLPIKPEQSQRFYYQPYLDLFSDELQHENKTDDNGMLYKSIGFDSLNRTKYSISIERSILEKVIRNELVKKIEPISVDDWYLGSDGIGLKKEEATEADCIEYNRHHRKRS
jgi:hypothetical protein